MRKQFITALLTLLCAGHLSAQQLHILTKDSLTQKSVSGALIRLMNTNINITTGKNGSAALKLSPGSYQLSCMADGYHPGISTINIPADTLVVIELKPLLMLTEEVTVTALRNSAGSPMATSDLSKEEIASLNLGQDVPYLLQLLPSTVVSSDAGTGIGYTDIRIRGTDPSRINVTINGIPLNDAESQQVYWVDLPDFASSTENIQVQRGIGSSTNGAGAFGGSVNLLSSRLSDSSYTSTSAGFGSFHTLKNNVQFGTGIIKNHFAFEGRLSRISSDGYVDRGSSELKSFYMSGGYSDSKSLLRLDIFSGHETTYQSWNGIPESRYNGDVQGMYDYINRNYLDEAAAANLLQSGITYNSFTYDNQVDDYKQDHAQLHYSRSLSDALLFNVAVHFTHGLGYYEEYKAGDALSKYLIDPVITGTDTITSSDLIRRKWLDNNFYGTTFSLKGNWTGINAVVGGAWNEYDGKHYGEVIWSRYASNSDIRHRYYDNKAVKKDFNLFGKVSYALSNSLTALADLQVRTINYSFTGADAAGLDVPQSASLTFFNPKAGLTYDINDHHQLYASVAVGNKEPNRDDYVESSPGSRPKPESMTDYEAGYRMNMTKLKFKMNFYYMNYKDQLVLTGAVNDVGNYTHVNIPESYRAGVELEAGYAITRYVAVDANLTVSDNRITDYKEYTDVYDADFNYTGQEFNAFHHTPIAFSPPVTGMGRLSIQPFRHFTVQVIDKYVSDQFLDNTGDNTRKLKAYTVTDLRLEYQLKPRHFGEVQFNVLLNNLFSEKYASNGYTYGYIVQGSQRTTENFYYPQATFNVLGQVTLKF